MIEVRCSPIFGQVTKGCSKLKKETIGSAPFNVDYFNPGVGAVDCRPLCLIPERVT